MNKLFEALCKAQAVMPVIGKNSQAGKDTDKFKYKYADIADIIKICAPILSQHGLAVIHRVNFDESGHILETMLIHTSGEQLCSQIRITPANNDIKSFGAAITYLRRYAYAAIIGLAIGDDDNEDSLPPASAYENKTAAPASNHEMITEEQIEILEDELKGHDDIKSDILKTYKSYYSIPKFKFQSVLAAVKRIKANKLA